MRWFLLLSVWAAASLAGQQTSGELTRPDEVSKKLLLAVRAKVMQTINRLPRYMCTETIDRSTFLSDAKLASVSCDDSSAPGKKSKGKIRKDTSDRLRLDVAVSSSTEMYSWAGEDSFGDSSLADLVGGGTTSTGAFSGFMTTIFGSNAASFTYNWDVTADGRTLAQFGYRVPIERSEYHISRGALSFVVAYDGTFLVDPKTFELLSLTVRANHLPSELHACEDTTIMDYSRVHLNNADFLLPKEVTLRVLRPDGTQLENRTVFSGCHEFLGKSSLSFDTDAPSDQRAPGKQASQPVVIPPGLEFRIMLRRAIETATAAAGDSLQAELKTAIKGPHGMVLVPKGARIAGRIVQVKRYYGTEAELLSVLVRLDTIEVGGTPQKFDVRLQNILKGGAQSGQFATTRRNLGRFDQIINSEIPGLGELEFQNVPSSYVIERGFEIEGETAPHASHP